MKSKNDKYIYLVLGLTILLLGLFIIDRISLNMFALLLIPLSLSMLTFGIMELNDALKNKDKIEI